MAFTDDDLKRVKEDLVPYFPHKLEALIARMQAAEKVIANFATENASPELSNAYMAWRKAAGK